MRKPFLSGTVYSICIVVQSFVFYLETMKSLQIVLPQTRENKHRLPCASWTIPSMQSSKHDIVVAQGHVIIGTHQPLKCLVSYEPRAKDSARFRGFNRSTVLS